MREYKFQGKRLDNGEWAYGSLILDGREWNEYPMAEEVKS